MRLALGVVALIIAIVSADYAGAFGVREMQMQDLLHLRLKVLDKVTGQIVTGVHVTCARRGSEEACSQKPEVGDGLLELNFVVLKSARYTRLFRFTKAEKLWLNEDSELVLVFIHPDYERLFLTLDTTLIEQAQAGAQLIELDPAGGE